MKLSRKVIRLKVLFRFAGICSFVFISILSLCWQPLISSIIKSQIQLNPHSLLYKLWIKNQIPIYLEIYLFNFTNANEYERNKSILPHFEDIGPFFFEETREKVDISWNDIRETVTFNQSKKWQYIPELSKNLSLTITNINPIASTIGYMSRLWKSKLQREIANALLNAHEPLTVTASAREWIFDGLPDPFLEMFRTLRKVTEIPIPYDKFGWFHERNGSSAFEGTFTIETGNSRSELGKMVAWNGANRTTHYEDACAEIRGCTGEIIPPLNPFRETLSVFAPDICSHVSLRYNGSVVFEGLAAYEYVGDESVFDNGTRYPENACFYIGESCPSGLRNVSSCKFGSPAFISFPHFYLADSYYLEKITGMNPDESKHKFRLLVEPKTGVPLAVNGSFQINFLVEPYAWCDDFREISKMYVPMLWFKQSVEMPGDYSTILHFVFFVQRYGSYLIYFTFLFLVLLPWFWITKKFSKKRANSK